MTIDNSNSQSKLVSVICRSIGRPELQQALESIAAQQYRPIEIILVEAFAESLAHFEKYAGDIEIKRISKSTKLPRSVAANAGLEAATGDFVLFLDDDDWITPEHIQNLVQSINKQDEIKAVYGSTQKVSADGQTNKDIFSHEFDRQLLMRDNFIPIHSMLFSRSLLEFGCKFDESFDIFEDWDFWLQLSQHTDFLHVDTLSAIYRDGGESETASGSASQRYLSDNVMGAGRAKLFEKWLKIWSGRELNSFIGSMDNSETLTQLNDTIATLNTSLHEHQIKVHNVTSDLLTANSSLKDSTQELNRLRPLVEEGNRRIAVLSEERVKLVNSSQNKDDQLDALTAHANELDTLLHTIYNSVTWKMMGPLRRIARITKSVFGAQADTPNKIKHKNERGDEESQTATRESIAAPHDRLRYAVDRVALIEGYLYLRGWACATNGIKSVELVCGKQTIPIVSSAYRDDIAIAFPHIEDAENSGFNFFDAMPSDSKLILKITPNNGPAEKLKLTPDTSMSLKEISNNGEFIHLGLTDQYKIYKRMNEEKIDVNSEMDALTIRPLISIIIPVYNVEKRWLDECIQSVLTQSYPRWELCLFDDASTNAETLDCLREWETKDDRIKVGFGKENGHISIASNNALKMTSGEFIGLMDNDDVLAQDALFWVVAEINKSPDVDYLYTDEDKIDEQGVFCQPHFKPDWSPELLESMMYVGHFGVIRKTVIESVGGFREGLEGSQDYDLTLRIAATTQRFSHIARVLYHWRIIPGSVSGGDDAKSYAYTSAVKALTDYANANGNTGTVSKTEFTGLYRIQRPNHLPRVAIVMPFHNKAEMTIDCLRSLEKSSYANYEILAISNNSAESEFNKVADYVKGRDNCQIKKLDIPFNWSAINNWGCEQVTADYYLFLNNDMTLISEDWIETLLGCAAKEEVAVVGAKLLYLDDSIQHSGITMQIGGIAGHPFRNVPDESPGYFGYAAVNRNMSAVTGACMLVKKTALESVGGFDSNLSVAYNDVDFCLRLREKGYRVVYTPFAKLYHLESKTRPKTVSDMNQAEREQFETESAYIKTRHPSYFENGDPFYNKAFTLKMENYTLRV